MKSYPFCSVIVLNYFGEKVLGKTLKSLLSLNYPKDKYEIIVVDNDSKDSSKDLLTEYAKAYSKIKPIFLNHNYGFSKGNNFGIKEAKGEYVALLNNDCVVDKDWLKELVITAVSDNSIFSVNSKILLYPRYISFEFSINSKLVPVYAWLSKSKLRDYTGDKRLYFPMWKKFSNSLVNCKVEVAYDLYGDAEIELSILFSSRGKKVGKDFKINEAINFAQKSAKIKETNIRGDEIECKVAISLRGVNSKAQDKIQNAGIMVFQDGYGRDIGALVRESQQFYEYDTGQYDQTRDIYASCGAAVLYSKKILEEIGYLDETFFMYYEDVEICERARFAGFKSVYSPKAVVRHFHALSSKEASPFFVYHVERGRLLHVFYNFPFLIFIKEYLYMSILNLATLVKIILSLRRFIFIIRSRKVPDQEVKVARRIQIIKSLSYFVFNIQQLYWEKMKRDNNRNKNAVNDNYQKILSGKWYLK